MNKKELSVILPVYNEKTGIRETITLFEKIVESIPFDIEVILVNDCSDDGTEEYLSGYRKDKFVVVHHSRNLGYGRAIKTGMKIAKYKYVAITDADGTYPNIRIPEMFERLYEQNLDMLVGARIGENVQIPFVRKPAKWILNQIANYLTNIKIPDLNSGLRIMKKDTVENFLNILPDGFSFTTTITLSMLTNGYEVEFIPIDYHPRKGSSKIRPIYDTLNFLQLILRTTLYFNPLKIFLPASILFIIASFLWGVSTFVFFERFADTSTLLLFLTGIHIAVIGLLADLIDRKTSDRIFNGDKK